MAMDDGHNLRIRALFGDDMPRRDTKRNSLLRNARHLRALRSWITIGAYAWWRLTDDLKIIQREMVKERASILSKEPT